MVAQHAIIFVLEAKGTSVFKFSSCEYMYEFMFYYLPAKGILTPQPQRL